MSRLKRFVSSNKLPLFVLLLFALVQLIGILAYPPHLRHLKPISWDTFGYYLYLPSIFIYHDLFQLHFAEAMMRKYDLSAYFYAARTGPLGAYVMNYPLGAALLYSPFFFMGHLVAKLSGHSADGFSGAYQYAVFTGGVFYSFAGVAITIRNLRFFFSERLTATLIFILLFGTNYFYYTTVENAMAHNYLFTVAAGVIYFSIQWHNNPKGRYAFMIGILLGLAVIIRPTEILWCIIPLLWSITGKESVARKFALVKAYWVQVLYVVWGAFLMGALQMIYWKVASGKFLYYSYDGGFDFLHPNIIRGLFSLRKGWLVYTPGMTLALAGIPLLWFRSRDLLVVCAVYTLLVIYVTFSWTSWLYGGSFGQRPMVETYALLLFPMGACVQVIWSRTFKFLLLPFIGCCIFLNCFQTWQFLQGFLSAEGPNSYMYKIMFLKTHQDRQLVRNYFDLEPRPSSVQDSLLIYEAEAMPKDSISKENDGWKISEVGSKLLLDTMIGVKTVSCLRISGKAKFDPFQIYPDKFSKMEVTMHSSIGKEKVNIMPLQPLIGNATIWWERDMMGVPGRWDDIYMYLELPQADKLQLRIELKNPGQTNLYFDSLRVWLLKKEGN